MSDNSIMDENISNRLHERLIALTEADIRHENQIELVKELREADIRFYEERDRRYAEVSEERIRAYTLKTLEQDKALVLARSIQDYKDEKANDLRSQIESERGSYMPRDEYDVNHKALEDKLDVLIKPLQDFMVANEGGRRGQAAIGYLMLGGFSFISVLIAVVTIALRFQGH